MCASPLQGSECSAAASPMAEVGLLAFARTTMEVGRAVLPPYRTRFSNHQFTQPELLAILCLGRYEDGTFREAEVRLREHRELRLIPGVRSVPDFTTVYRFLKRLEGPTIERAVGETVRRMGGGQRGGRRRARVAVDRHGLGARSVIPANRGKKTWHVRGVRAELRRAFPHRIYRRRALIESVFSSVKRKLSARAPGRSLRMQTL